MKLQPYRQIFFLAKQLSNKLSKRYYGPFVIQERIGKVAYRLELPKESKLHPVFHISLLKQYKGTLVSCESDLPEETYMKAILLSSLW